jgi:non-specific serine/threonine protein kinase
LVGVVVLAVVGALALSGGGNDDHSSEPSRVVAATTLPKDLSWQPIADLPVHRQYAAATAKDGKVYVVGGIATQRTSGTSTKIYDPASNTWSTGPGIPLPLHHFSAVDYKGQVVVIGGFVPGVELTSRQSRDVFVLREGQPSLWQKLPSLKYPRAAAAAAVVGNRIVVVGGQANGRLVPQTEVFDGKRWTVAANIPTPREHLGAASDGRYLYAVGGRKLSAATNSNAFERYDPTSDRWTKLTPMPKRNGGLSAAYAGGRIVTVGGEGITAASAEVRGYDIKDATWSELPPLSGPRHGVATAVIKDMVYAIGGATQAGHVGSTNKAEVLDLSGKSSTPIAVNVKWREVTPAPAKVQYAAATQVAGRIWTCGGIDDNEKATSRTAIYDPPLSTWAPGPPLPAAVHHAAAVTYNGEPVVIGGFLPGSGDQLTAGVSDHVYAFRGQKWEALPRLNHARAAAAAAVVGDKIVVVGGQADG